MATAVPAGVGVADQAQVRLVNQGGRLKRLAGGQPAGHGDGQPAQLRIDDRQQFRRLLDFQLGPFASLFGHCTRRSPGEENGKS